MRGNRNVTPENKLRAVKAYLTGQGSSYSIANKYGVTRSALMKWVGKYKNFGDKAFLHTGCNAKYTKNFKKTVVTAYLHGEDHCKSLLLNINFLHRTLYYLGF